MMMMSSQGICKKEKKKESGYSATHPGVLASSSSADHPGYSSIFFASSVLFHNAILWNAPRTHNNQQIMPLIISGMSIHLWLALCPSSPAASNFPRRVRPAKKVRIYEVFNQRGGGVSLESEWSCAVTVGKMHFPA